MKISPSPSKPPNGIQTAKAMLSHIVMDTDFMAVHKWDIDPHQLHLVEPYKVLFVSREDLINGHFLSSSQHTHWQYLIADNEEHIVGTIELVHDEDRKHPFHRFSISDFGKETLNALKMVEKEAEENGEYELRLFRIPALYVVGIHLRGKMHENDMIALLHDYGDTFKKFQLYTEHELLQTFRLAAIAQKNHNDFF